eukprot:SAG22_NODE_1449_length_4399_cov_6.411860_2_plen_319_part_00
MICCERFSPSLPPTWFVAYLRVSAAAHTDTQDGKTWTNTAPGRVVSPEQNPGPLLFKNGSMTMFYRAGSPDVSSGCSDESIGVSYCANKTALCTGGHNPIYKHTSEECVTACVCVCVRVRAQCLALIDPAGACLPAGPVCPQPFGVCRLPRQLPHADQRASRCVILLQLLHSLAAVSLSHTQFFSDHPSLLRRGLSAEAAAGRACVVSGRHNLVRAAGWRVQYDGAIHRRDQHDLLTPRAAPDDPRSDHRRAAGNDVRCCRLPAFQDQPRRPVQRRRRLFHAGAAHVCMMLNGRQIQVESIKTRILIAPVSCVDHACK